MGVWLLTSSNDDGTQSQSPSQYRVRSRKISNPRDFSLECSYRSEIWQVARQQYCRATYQISERLKYLKHLSRAFDTLRDITIRCPKCDIEIVPVYLPIHRHITCVYPRRHTAMEWMKQIERCWHHLVWTNRLIRKALSYDNINWFYFSL